MDSKDEDDTTVSAQDTTHVETHSNESKSDSNATQESQVVDATDHGDGDHASDDGGEDATAHDTPADDDVAADGTPDVEDSPTDAVTSDVAPDTTLSATHEEGSAEAEDSTSTANTQAGVADDEAVNEREEGHDDDDDKEVDGADTDAKDGAKPASAEDEVTKNADDGQDDGKSAAAESDGDGGETDMVVEGSAPDSNDVKKGSATKKDTGAVDNVGDDEDEDDDNRQSISPADAQVLQRGDNAGADGDGNSSDTSDVNGPTDAFDTTAFSESNVPELPRGWQRAWTDEGKLFYHHPATGDTSDSPPSPTAHTDDDTKNKQRSAGVRPPAARPQSRPASSVTPTRAQFDADPHKWTLLESLSRAKFDLGAIDIGRFQQRTKVVIEHPKQTIGVSVKDSRNDTLLPGAVVTHILPGSAASKHVELGVGDIIVSLDGKSLIGLPFPKILKLLQRAAKATTTTLEFIPAQKVFAHKVKSDEKVGLGLVLDGNFIKSVLPDSPAEKYGVPPSHYILSVQDLSVANMTTEELGDTFKKMYGEFTILTMAKSVYEAQRLGRGKLQNTVADGIKRTTGSIASSIKRRVGK
eukprot:m.29741 g.29741  ORF g.29741 m.29741 type:complete len:583 (-) comp4627_c0_seq1:154-1902(-)